MSRFSWFRSKGEPSRAPRTTTATLPPVNVAEKVDRRTAEAAQAMLENPAFERVMSRLRAERFAAFSQAEPGNLPAIMEARYGIAALDRVAADIQAYADQLKVERMNEKRASVD